jgi:glucose dehydrogenase
MDIVRRRSAQLPYSPLDQINASNFNKLEVAWRFKTDALGPRPEFKLDVTYSDATRFLLRVTSAASGPR